MSKSIFRLAASLGLLQLLPALIASPKSLAAENDGNKNEAAAKSTDVIRGEAIRADYVLQPEDLIKVLVFQEEDINRLGEVRISQESTITLPLIGVVDITGLTARALQEKIRQLYDHDFLVNPQVSVTVLEYKHRFVTVIGQVGTQGQIEFSKEQGLNLLDAISRAGGFNRYANKKKVTLKRTMPDGKVVTETIDVDSISKGDSTKTYPLEPGDIIQVPEVIL